MPNGDQVPQHKFARGEPLLWVDMLVRACCSTLTTPVNVSGAPLGAKAIQALLVMKAPACCWHARLAGKWHQALNYVLDWQLRHAHCNLKLGIVQSKTKSTPNQKQDHLIPWRQLATAGTNTKGPYIHYCNSSTVWTLPAPDRFIKCLALFSVTCSNSNTTKASGKLPASSLITQNARQCFKLTATDQAFSSFTPWPAGRWQC